MADELENIINEAVDSGFGARQRTICACEELKLLDLTI